MSKIRRDFRVGKRIVFTGGGVDSGRRGTVIKKSLVKTDGRGVPKVGRGHYKPLSEWGDWVAVRYDNGDIDAVLKAWISPESTRKNPRRRRARRNCGCKKRYMKRNSRRKVSRSRRRR